MSRGIKSLKNRTAKKSLTAAVAPYEQTLSQRVRAANRYRDTLNPMRGLTMARAVRLIESYARGEFADLMWTFGAPYTGIESADADLSALIECRTSVLSEMDWDAKSYDPKKRAGFDKGLAEEQQAAIREWADGISNLYAAIDHFEVGAFRGFAHCEPIHRPDGELCELRVVNQWNIVRDGSCGQWKYNPDALQTTFTSLDASLLIEPEYFVIREVSRPIGRIALTKAIREGLSQKDWDAFIEIYGLPGGVATLPQDVPSDKIDDYKAAAAELARGGSGALPFGATYTPNDGPRGTNPFRDHLNYLSEKLILAGTGGKLTMLTESGSGTLAGSAHTETFQRIGRKSARQISEIFQTQVFAPMLDAQWPDKPQLAYFELAFREEVDGEQVIDDIATLAKAGYEVPAAQVAEKTGYDVEYVGVAAQPITGDPVVADDEKAAMKNRRSRVTDQMQPFLANCKALLGKKLQPVITELRPALTEAINGDDSDFIPRLQAIRDRLPQILKNAKVSRDLAEAFERIFATAFFTGVTSETTTTS